MQKKGKEEEEERRKKGGCGLRPRSVLLEGGLSHAFGNSYISMFHILEKQIQSAEGHEAADCRP